MAHYAVLDENNKVIDVIVGKDEEDNIDWELEYSKVTGKVCKRTSYNTFAGKHINGGTPFRKNYAGIGYSYDPELDAFIPHKDLPSYILNTETGLWEPPIPYPNDGEPYIWDESTLSWIPYPPEPE